MKKEIKRTHPDLVKVSRKIPSEGTHIVKLGDKYYKVRNLG